MDNSNRQHLFKLFPCDRSCVQCLTCTNSFNYTITREVEIISHTHFTNEKVGENPPEVHFLGVRN